VYPSISLAIASILLYARNDPYPTLFHTQQVCLFITVIASLGTAGFAAQRYSHATPRRGTVFLCVSAVAMIVTSAAAMMRSDSVDAVVFVSSSLVVLCVALVTLLILRAEPTIFSKHSAS
jgi:hypothetical protein